MDVSQDLADYAAKNTSNLLERSQPVQVDLGLLAGFDNTPVDPEAYKASLNSHILALTLTSTSSLLSSLFALPTTSGPAGPQFTLPAPTTILPREKPLPKPKPLTKWERFAKEKGISHKRTERDEWDDEKQEWVRRWGRGGKNRQAEDQWLHEVKAKPDTDHDPAATAKAERKARIAKNQSQAAANLAIASSSKIPEVGPHSSKKEVETARKGKTTARQARVAELDRTMMISSTATASMGKFDKKIDGEPKAKGVKRKFDPLVGTGDMGKNWGEEKGKALDVLRKVESGEGRKLKGTGRGEGEVNTRKAVRNLEREQRAQAKKARR